MPDKREALLVELGNLLDVEIKLEQLMKQRAHEVQGAEVHQAFQQHALKTQQKVRNLKRCFAVLDAPPRCTACLAVERWERGHARLLLNRSWPEDVITMFNLNEARRIARYEIASYQRVIKQAETLGEEVCANLLRQNLLHEECMASKVSQFSRELAPQLRPE